MKLANYRWLYDRFSNCKVSRDKINASGLRFHHADLGASSKSWLECLFRVFVTHESLTLTRIWQLRRSTVVNKAVIVRLIYGWAWSIGTRLFTWRNYEVLPNCFGIFALLCRVSDQSVHVHSHGIEPGSSFGRLKIELGISGLTRKCIKLKQCNYELLSIVNNT